MDQLYFKVNYRLHSKPVNPGVKPQIEYESAPKKLCRGHNSEVLIEDFQKIAIEITENLKHNDSVKFEYYEKLPENKKARVLTSKILTDTELEIQFDDILNQGYLSIFIVSLIVNPGGGPGGGEPKPDKVVYGNFRSKVTQANFGHDKIQRRAA